MPKITPLKLSLLELGISQRALSRETGINPAQICWISQGRLLPNDIQKEKIAAALKIEPDKLFIEGCG